MKYAFLLGAAFLSCSCATVVRGTKDTAEFESLPTGATVTTESLSEDKLGPFECVTPCRLELKRKRTWVVDFSLEGYKPASGLLKPQVTGGGLAAGAGNALIGGIVGIGIDAGTGANLDLRPNPMIAELEPLDSPKASRILNAETVNGDGSAPPAEDAPPEPAAVDAPLTDEGAPADETPVAPAEEAIEDAAPEDATTGTVVDDAGEIATETVEDAVVEPVRLFKPGEIAPNDEDADDLNRRQLEKIENLPQQ